MEQRTQRLPGGTLVYTGAGVGFSADALFLAHFSALKKGRALDIGTGCGILPLALFDAGFAGSFTALELDAGAAALARRAAEDNRLACEVLCCDARGYRTSAKFDAAVCNPPYFGAGRPSPDGYRAAARHTLSLTAADAAGIARRSLREGGRLYMCYAPARLETLLAALRENELSLKRLRFVRERAGGPASLALADAVYRGGEGADILPDLVVRLADGSYSPEAARALGAAAREDKQ
ncbi:MAG: methyltransferase [Oscillospiraceae bacterium]|nr:methyltransferase [Oscillospiraceae bacterium]